LSRLELHGDVTLDVVKALSTQPKLEALSIALAMLADAQANLAAAEAREQEVLTHLRGLKATFDALANCTSPRAVAARRGTKVSDLLGPRKDGTPDPAAEAANG
jgi:hypothetical protein